MFQGIVTRFAGGGNGRADGIGTVAKFNQPMGLAVTSMGVLYVADFTNNCIRRVSPSGTIAFVVHMACSVCWLFALMYCTILLGVIVIVIVNVILLHILGMVTTLAGGGLIDINAGHYGYLSGYIDGQGTNALFNQPSGVAVDSLGIVYVADRTNNMIRKISPSGFEIWLFSTVLLLIVVLIVVFLSSFFPGFVNSRVVVVLLVLLLLLLLLLLLYLDRNGHDVCRRRFNW